jgi:hypothetical protein
MAKKAIISGGELIIDKTLLIGLLCAATAYIMKGTWAAMFFEATAIFIGIIWSYRVITTHPAKTFRLLATLMLVLLWSLSTFYIASAYRLL